MRKNFQISLFILVFGLFGNFLLVGAITDITLAPANQISNIRVSNITATSTQVSWVTSTSTNYNYINYGTSTGMLNSFAYMGCNGLYQQTSLSLTHCVTIQNLIPHTLYYYKILDTTSSAGTISNTTQVPSGYFTTLSLEFPVLTPIAPPAPSSVTVTTSTSNASSIAIFWVTSSTNQTRFEITKTMAGGNPVVLSSLVEPTLRTFTDTITSIGTYTYGVKACNIDSCSSVSTGSITTSIPTSPSPISATLSSDTNSVNLSWIDTSSNETRFEIYRGTSTVFVTLITEKNIGITTYSDIGLSPSTYVYGIAACNTFGCSQKAYFTPSITIATLTSTSTIVPVTPGQPTGLSVSTSSANSVLIKWTDTTNETGYKIIRSPSTANSIMTNANATSYTDSSLSPGNYYYTISACNGTANCSQAVSLGNITIPVPKALAPTIEASFNPASITSTSSTSFSYSSVNANSCQVVSSNGNPLFTSNSTQNSTVFNGANYLSGLTAIVTCYNSDGVSANLSKTLIVTNASSAIILGQPSNPYVAINSSSSLRIYWGDTTNETNYKIVRTPATVSSIIVNAGVTSYLDSGLTPGTYYSYTIQACNGTTNCSEPVYAGGSRVPQSIISPIVTATATIATSSIQISFGDDTVVATTAVATIPISPTSATGVRNFVNGVPTNSVHVSWLDMATNKTGFKLERSSLSSHISIPITNSKNNFYDDNNLTPGTYTYYLALCNDKGCSSSVRTNEIFIPEEKPVVTTQELASLLEISNAVGKTTPGTFINITPTIQTSISQLFITTALPDGTFQIKVPDGTYIVEGIVPVKIITLLSGKVTSVVDKITTSTKTITGIVTFPDGKPVMNAEVGAYKKETSEWLTSTTDSYGKYSIRASSGSFDLTVRPKIGVEREWVAPQMVSTVTFTYENNNENKEDNFIVTPITSNLTVVVKDENDTPISPVGITIDTLSSLSTLPRTSLSGIRKIFTEKTDVSGQVVVHISQGKYFIRTVLSNTSEYSEAVESSIVIADNTSRTVTIILKKQNLVKTSKVTGMTKFNDGMATDAFVSAWSNEGGSAEMKTGTNGIYSFDLNASQTWHIKATKDALGKSYVSDEQTIVTTASNKTVDLTFVKTDAVILPTTVVMQKSSNEQVTLSSDNGARFSLPANAVTSSGDINVTIKPTTETSSYSASSVVSTAYDITVKNTEGQKLTTLASPAEILIPYDEKELEAKGVALENVIPSYYDENLNTWVSVSDFTINRVKKVFVLRVNHLTRFALIAAADTTAPSSPTNIITDAITPTDVRITWQNPTVDFNHSKIYRSETPGNFGNVIASEVFTNSFIDTTSSLSGKVYYYTVRAVDSAGNESTNNNQMLFTFKGNSLAQTKKPASLLLPPLAEGSDQIVRMLSYGDEGDDVIALQKALKIDGFYKTGPITGYFGKLTQNAVLRFQNYYKEEILIPQGFKKGTGMVGDATRKKINNILINGAQ